jgi:hypothetical protein
MLDLLEHATLIFLLVGIPAAAGSVKRTNSKINNDPKGVT